jgi:beta-mannosidase
MEHIVKELNRNWSLKEVEENKKYKAKVPGSVYETLLENNVIKDPFYGINEKDCQWVYETDWEYSTIISFSKEIVEKDYCMLRFNGLDTYCQVILNDRVILFGENMHRTYEVYIKTKEYSFLEEGDNKLTIRFRSPVKEAQEKLKQSGLSIDSKSKYHLPFAIPGVEMLRKAYYSFGWDWGPKLPDSGIWRTVELHAFNDSYIRSVQVQTEIEFIIGDGNGRPTAKEAEITLETELEDFRENGDKTILYQVFDGEVLLHSEKIDSMKMGTEKKLMIKNPKLWWSHDLGKPNLYRLIVKLFDGEQLLDEYSTHFGIREICLIRKEDRWGETFYFELNKIPVFAKGGNWVPTDSFLTRGTRKKTYKKILDACVQANMNMIRVWGGGIYEEDAFYHYCDEKGLLVWQDFAFACRPTPDYSGFEESVIKEAIDNIKRLRNHPSLAIWVGNNEIEEGWLYWGFDQFVPQYKSFYIKLFEETLPQLIKDYDPFRPYWPSSPSSGGSFQDPQSPNYGDSHYWKVWHEGFPLESYRTFDSRFMSEFGFESFPDIKTIKSFCKTNQMYYDSKIMENHQKNPAGNQKIYDYMEKRFKIPQSFEKQVILSQITQAEAMEYGVEHWRRNRNNCHCMGALYWQINDCWPVASWSSIDYYGRWKALHYFAKRFYNPFYINAHETPEFFEIWFCNDLPVKFNGRYAFKLMDLTGEILYQKEGSLYASGLFSSVVERVNFKDIGIDSKNTILFFKAFDQSDKCVSEGFKLFTPPKNLSLLKPTIKYKIEKEENKNSLIIQADKPVLYCLIESTEDLIFSDNYFSFSGEKKVVHFRYDGEISDQSIHVRSLFDFLTD